MADFGSSSTTVVRQRTFNGPHVDVEKAGELKPNGNRETPPLNTGSTAIRQLEELEAGLTRFWNRFRRKGKKNVPVVASLRAIAFSSWLNLFVIFIPLAWIGHFVRKKNELGEEVEVFPHTVTFTFCFLALVPLEWLFDWGGEQMAFYLGTQLGDLVLITLNNVVEATLAIILLGKCEVLSLLLPAAFFSTIDRGVSRELNEEVAISLVVNDSTRHTFLVISRGLAVILLSVYVSSRIFLHNPPGDNNALTLDVDAPAAMWEEERELLREEPKANQYVLIVVLLISIAIMAATTEWLVESIEFVRESGNIGEEWFGMFLLPITSWAANGFVTIVYFFRYLFKHFFKEPEPPAELAKARAIDLSIQFTLFWMPFLVMLGWWINKPMSLLFDFFEVAILIGSCFIVNYVTADAKTNWAEGFAMVAFYCMIAVSAWFYTGQPEIEILLSCESVAEALAALAAGGAHE
ncbi:hypothetical protein C0995_013057 [Termitomyces sp. Mi166|nr:hypothetical protein C0995_013057 [Termitomyces sp. Mi166\